MKFIFFGLQICKVNQSAVKNATLLPLITHCTCAIILVCYIRPLEL